MKSLIPGTRRSLRVRYLLPITVPTTTATATATGTTTTNAISNLAAAVNGSGVRAAAPRSSLGGAAATAGNAGGLFFDPSVVARNDPGWEDMLQAVLLRWVAAVVDERRGEAES